MLEYMLDRARFPRTYSDQPLAESKAVSGETSHQSFIASFCRSTPGYIFRFLARLRLVVPRELMSSAF